METEILYTLGSVILVSIISLVGIIALAWKEKFLNKILLLLVGFSAGALIGDVFIHIIPELVEEGKFTLTVSLSILAGIILFFILEKVIFWHHCHLGPHKHHVHEFGFTNLIGDALHNLLDGLIIGASYLVSIPLGIATTVAVIFHEIPQEIGDFGVLIHAGYSKAKALFFNFLTACFAILGGIIAIALKAEVELLEQYLIPVIAGGFIYIAIADLIPELKKEEKTGRSIMQIIWFILGIAVMLALLLLE